MSTAILKKQVTEDYETLSSILRDSGQIQTQQQDYFADVDKTGFAPIPGLGPASWNIEVGPEPDLSPAMDDWLERWRERNAPNGSTGVSYTYTEVDYTETERVTQPAQEYVAPEPAKSPIVDRHLGWNGGARSLDRLDGDLHLTFEARPANGVGVGLSKSREDNHFRSILYCFLLRNGRYQIFEKGDEKHGPIPYDPHDVFTILRIGGTVIYKRNHVEVYRSGTPSYGSLITVAAMYTGGDRVL